MLLIEVFKDMNFQVFEAEEGQQAILLADQNRPDIIFMDIQMPVLDGYEATKLIRDNGKLKNIPVIALTASGMAEERKKINNFGLDGFLLKPVETTELVEELKKHISYVSEK